jgi:hypothetical protein
MGTVELPYSYTIYSSLSQSVFNVYIYMLMHYFFLLLLLYHT